VGMRRRGFRKWAKWACTMMCGDAIGLALLTRFFRLRAFGFCRDDTAMWCVYANNGLVYGGVLNGFGPGDFPTVSRFSVERSSGWMWGVSAENGVWAEPPYWHAGVSGGRNRIGWEAGTSVLYPVILSAACAGVLWYADLRPGPAHQCRRCGYDRRGLAADAPCPECAAAAPIK